MAFKMKGFSGFKSGHVRPKTNKKSKDGKTEEYPSTMSIMDQMTRQHDAKHRPKSDEDAFVRDTKILGQKATLTDKEIAARKAKQLNK